MTPHIQALRAHTDERLSEMLAMAQRINDSVQATNAALRERQARLHAELDALGLPRDIATPVTPEPLP